MVLMFRFSAYMVLFMLASYYQQVFLFVGGVTCSPGTGVDNVEFLTTGKCTVPITTAEECKEVGDADHASGGYKGPESSFVVYGCYF